MDPRAESIKQEVDETLEDMTHKMEQIEAKVVDTARETYENVKHTAQEKVEKVKQKLDVRHMTEERPWTMFGLSLAAGFLLGNITKSMRQPRKERLRSSHEEEGEEEHEEERWPARRETMGEREEESWRGEEAEGAYRPRVRRKIERVRERAGGLRAMLEDQFGDELAAFKTAAMASAGRSLRGFLHETLPNFAEEFERARSGGREGREDTDEDRERRDEEGASAREREREPQRRESERPRRTREQAADEAPYEAPYVGGGELARGAG